MTNLKIILKILKPDSQFIVTFPKTSKNRTGIPQIHQNIIALQIK